MVLQALLSHFHFLSINILFYFIFVICKIKKTLFQKKPVPKFVDLSVVDVFGDIMSPYLSIILRTVPYICQSFRELSHKYVDLLQTLQTKISQPTHTRGSEVCILTEEFTNGRHGMNIEELGPACFLAATKWPAQGPLMLDFQTLIQENTDYTLFWP